MSSEPFSTIARSAAVKMRSSPVQKIDLFIGYMHINGVGYLRVADAIADGSIKVSIGDLPAGAAAAFYPGDMFYRFPDASYGLTQSDEEDFVHESTHA
jgi:hypothetical protein